MKSLLITLALLRAGDMATTQRVLAQGGGIESGPFLPQNRTANLLVGVGATGAELYGLQKIAEKHKALGVTLTVGAILAEGYAVRHNLTQMRR